MEILSITLDPEAVVHGVVFTASMMAGRVLVTPPEELRRSWSEFRSLLPFLDRRRRPR
ncbi:MAG TPA: hypothetical protein VNK43_01020 [Gemmatimonadales bacterium]|nr:hypothetical protein [Gemmatimonadales bacterium]